MTERAGDAAGGTPVPPAAGATLTGPQDGLPVAGPLLPGDPRRLGGYRVLGRLGEGGMGTVFLASSVDGAPVAIKVIRAEYATNDQFRARFRAEANAARRVARFCTAQVLDVGTDGDAAYLVTEYIDGPTLAAVIAQDGPLRGSMLESLAIGVAAALNGIHTAGVVHRDLKPSNVLLSRMGPKVIDFGIARAVDGLDTLTDPGELIGTPAYMAPERFGGRVTAATDVFTWGAVVTYAGTGRTPFGTGTPHELMHRVTHDEPHLDGLDPPLRDLVARALSKRPEARPSARELLLELVGEADDPIGASTRVLSATWTPPPGAGPAPLAPGTRPWVGPTRVDDAPRGAPRRRWRTGRPIGRVTGRVRALGAATVAALVFVAALLLFDPETPDEGARPGGSPGASAPAGGAAEEPTHDPTETPGDTPGDTPGGGPDAPAGAGPRPIALGDRVPASGFAKLGVGQVHRYRIRLSAESTIFLEGHAEGCAHLLPWALAGPGGGTVADGELSCRTDGPLGLAAGDYELRVGGPGVEGRYAFRLFRG
jgi:hypothetical protein